MLLNSAARVVLMTSRYLVSKYLDSGMYVHVIVVKLKHVLGVLFPYG